MSHVKTELEENKSWCGEILGAEFYFANAELAAINGLSKTWDHFICHKCVDSIQKALEITKA